MVEALNHQQFAAVDETRANISPSPLWGEGRGEVMSLACGSGRGWRSRVRVVGKFHLFRQGMADFETFGELAEQDRVLFGQNASQPMTHELQNEFALTPALKLLL
ncbi:MAG: hypothetical protein WBW41_13670 [Verrucomicrobiia bacterium]